ncbi:glycosyltransferase family 39 protein, partial [Kingella kingae]|nr:glycosyltransferase family 39 protein [Kingella kingae]
MLTYTSRPKRPEPTHEYPWLLLLLAFCWLWPGVFSHDLWTPSEPKMMLAIDDAAQRGAWLPTVFGAAYFDVSPLYVQTAAWFKMLLSPWAADAFSAARFTSVLFTSLGLLGSGMAGYRFLGRHHGRSVVLILIGS